MNISSASQAANLFALAGAWLTSLTWSLMESEKKEIASTHDVTGNTH